jgi:hypothetical protein
MRVAAIMSAGSRKERRKKRADAEKPAALRAAPGESDRKRDDRLMDHGPCEHTGERTENERVERGVGAKTPRAKGTSEM